MGEALELTAEQKKYLQLMEAIAVLDRVHLKKTATFKNAKVIKSVFESYHFRPIFKNVLPLQNKQQAPLYISKYLSVSQL